jgi:pimeloyl-ACP methyl ester carboxylesterase
MARLVLVHGAFCGAWYWERVVEPLESRGHTVEVLDLPGSGDDQTPAEEVNLAAYVERVGAQLGERDEPAVLVAYSMGGVVATQAAARYPDQVDAVVYTCAFVPQDGQSLIDLTELPEGAGDQIQANLIVEGLVGRLTEEASRAAIYNETEEEDAAYAIAQRRPQPGLPFAEKVEIPDGAFDDIPRRYVHTTRDQSIPPPLQKRMIEENGITDVIEIDADHAPAFSRTDELVDAIDKLATLEPAGAP